MNLNWKEQISNLIITHSSDSKSYKNGPDLFFTPLYGSGQWVLRSFQLIYLGYDEESLVNNSERYTEEKKTTVLVNFYEQNPVAKGCV